MRRIDGLVFHNGSHVGASAIEQDILGELHLGLLRQQPVNIQPCRIRMTGVLKQAVAAESLGVRDDCIFL
ncbi:MAG: hypothetical protein L7F78_13225, partial [Syntrophales bacterium LBB04]|nr:hypothetical protein [Syntrophales bacterium LBB04]